MENGWESAGKIHVGTREYVAATDFGRAAARSFLEQAICVCYMVSDKLQ